MKKIATSFLAAFVLGIFTLSACGGGGGGDKCSKAADKMMSYMKSGEMEAEMKKMLDQLPEDMRKEAEAEMKKEMDKMDERKAEMVKQCQADLKDEKKKAKTEKELDCILASKSMDDASKCMGAGDMGDEGGDEGGAEGGSEGGSAE